MINNSALQMCYFEDGNAFNMLLGIKDTFEVLVKHTEFKFNLFLFTGILHKVPLLLFT